MIYTAGSTAGEHLTSTIQDAGFPDIPDYNPDASSGDMSLSAFVARQQGTLAEGVQAHTGNMLRDRFNTALANGGDTQALADAYDALHTQWIGEGAATSGDFTSMLSDAWTTLGWNHGEWDAAVQASQADTTGGAGLGITRTWRSVHGPHTRPEHAEADGQTVGLYDNFSVGGEDLMYPADPSGSAAMTYNCECYLEYDVTGNVSASVADDLIANSE